MRGSLQKEVMRLKNYTSGVPVNRTVARIEEVLAGAGASGISKDYKDGKLISITFRVRLSDQMEVNIRLPANVDAVQKTMMKEVHKPRKGTFDRIADQAERTAWKLVQDWCEVQVSLIRMQQAEFLQVFLPYVWDGQRTFFTAMKDGGFKQLQLTAGDQV
jgi:hypothetical protein